MVRIVVLSYSNHQHVYMYDISLKSVPHHEWYSRLLHHPHHLNKSFTLLHNRSRTRTHTLSSWSIPKDMRSVCGDFLDAFLFNLFFFSELT